jgi:dTDP-4-amino-4,6-dideoxygalactose transaminase
LGPAEEAAVLDVLRSGWLTTGSVTAAFEAEFAAAVGAKNALAVNSASSGLLLALQALGVCPGDAVVTTPYTFVSTAFAALHLGARLFYADICADSFNIDPEQVERRVIEAKKQGLRVGAIVVVHIGGCLCDMEQLLAIAERHGVPLVEDAAHAFPAKGPQGYAGTLADAGVFS